MSLITLTQALGIRDQDWRKEAACLGLPDIFFPGRGGRADEARQICTTCPVIDPCFDYSIALNPEMGVWGGMTRPERIRYRKTQVTAA